MASPTTALGEISVNGVTGNTFGALASKLTECTKGLQLESVKIKYKETINTNTNTNINTNTNTLYVQQTE